MKFGDPDRHHVALSAELENHLDDLAECSPRRWRVESRIVDLRGPVLAWRANQTSASPTSSTTGTAA